MAPNENIKERTNIRNKSCINQYIDNWFQKWDDINLAWNKSESDDIVEIFIAQNIQIDKQI